MDFPSLQAQLDYWFAPGNQHGNGFANISQTWGKNGEKGIDIVLPFHSAVYSPVAGVVKGSQVDASGLAVWIETAPDKMFYVQHLDTTSLSRNQYVQPGDYIGLSGGQNVGGVHPASPQFSTGPHIEVGFNWWQPLGKNFNPLPTLQTLAAAYREGPAIPTRKTGAAGTVTLSAGGCGSGWLGMQDTPDPGWQLCTLIELNPLLRNSFPCATPVCDQKMGSPPILPVLPSGPGTAPPGQKQPPATQQDIFAALGAWVLNPLRIVKLVLGGALILVALWIAFRQPIAEGIGHTAGFVKDVFL